MNIRKKVITFLCVAGFFSAFAVIPLFIFGGSETVRFFGGIFGVTELRFGDALPLVTLIGLLGVFGTMMLGCLRLLKNVVEPVRRMAEFTDHLAGGDMPQPLAAIEQEADEIGSLHAALNFLRDRQQNLQGKLKLSLAREAEVKREIERHDLLQLRILTGMLPELRQPLSIIKGMALVLKQGIEEGRTPDGEELRILDVIGKRIGSLSRRVDRMDDIGSLSRERWSVLHLESFNTADFLRELTERSTLSLQAREMTLVNHFSSSAPQGVRTDRELLFQLMNILIRAVARASAPGETVVLSCYSERRRVIFEVRDSHHGVCREELARIYLEHRKNADPSMLYPTSESLGVLGLCFVGDIATRIGCRLEVESTPEAYSILRLELDEKDCAVDSAENRAGNWRSSRSSQSEPDGSSEEPEGSCTPMKILLGDDNTDEVFILKRILGAELISVTAVDSAEAMQKEAEQGDYDGFVLVAPFRTCDPVELVVQLRRAAGRREVPAVVVVPRLSEERFRQLRELGRAWGMTFPLNYALLAKLLHQAGGHVHSRGYANRP